MPDILKNSINSLKRIPLKKKIALGTILALFVSSTVVTLMWIKTPEYKVLYANLDPQDAGTIINRLKEMRISYKLKDSGKIYVPEDKVYEIRIKLASEGLPKGKQAGFELFDKTSFGITDFAQKVNYWRALQGELSRTISSLNEVDWARVHIAMPKESLFIEKEKKPSVSVLLKIHPNSLLTEDKARAIAYLVSASVPRLDPKDVVIVDTDGHILAAGVNGTNSGKWLGDQLKMQNQLEAELEQKVKSLLEKAVGVGKVIAKVSVDMDFSRVEKREELYNPDEVAIRSEQHIEQTSAGMQTTPFGIPGVLSNLPKGQKGNITPTPLKQSRHNKIINYEISKTVKHITEPIGKIKRISVAVLVDGKYKEEEMKKFKAIVEKAVGYSKERGDQIDIVGMPFDKSYLKEEAIMQKKAESLEKRRFLYRLAISLAKGFTLVILVVILAILLKKLLNSLTPTALPELEGLPKPVRELEVSMEKPKALSLTEEIKEIAKKEPEKMAQIAKSWIREVK